MGRLLSRIQDQDLHAADGFGSLVAFAQAKLRLSAASVYRALAMYRNFSAEIAGTYGVSKLEAGLAYMRATPKKEQPGDLIAASIRLRENGKFVKRRFHDATVRQIRDATQLMRETHRPGRKVPKRIAQQITTLAKKLPHAPSRFVRGHRVRMHRDETSGRRFATVAALSLDKLD